MSTTSARDPYLDLPLRGVRLVEAHMSNLRRKIGAELIRTVRGVGYLLQA